MRDAFKHLTFVAGALSACLAFSTAAMAQDNSTVQGDQSINVESENAVISDAATKEAVEGGFTRATGWYPKLRIGGSAALNWNRNVDGVNDGTAFSFGVNLKGALDGVYKNLEWQNKLDIEHQQTKTPNIDHWIKSTDKFDFQTLLLFRIPGAEWVGPFARFRLQSSLLPGYYSSDKDLVVRFYEYGTKIDEKEDSAITKVRALAAQDQIKLSSAFEPLLLSESAGFFISPYSTEMLNVNFTVGVAGQHLISDGGYVGFDDDDDDAYYDVIELKDTNSFGIEGQLSLNGVFVGYVNWSLSGSLYYPFVMDEDHGLKDEELIHSDIEAKISVKMASWASLDYALTAKLHPFVTEEWQLTNTLLFNIGFDVF